MRLYNPQQGQCVVVGVQLLVNLLPRLSEGCSIVMTMWLQPCYNLDMDLLDCIGKGFILNGQFLN